ncbi:MAG TPA: hypothetical protein VFL99_15520 [Segeticoccus sp.]|uniref:hypothetical protein n=1 Tax=Segeticoccus sp. TaxID=2706531 RepID=UPI002D80C747|nr:hypothetical protein [Segeticoccus sp.]HET8601736.1 hypothetical protein [Segeticoccus sp.]
MNVTLLGPQRRPRLASVVRSLGLHGPFATVTAGWQEREPDDAELDQLLDGQSRNLGLWTRWQDVIERDPEFAAAHQQRRAVLEETQECYLLGLDHAVNALLELERRPIRHAEVRDAAVREAEWVIRKLDERHLQRTQAIHDEFHDRWRLHEREAIAHHRAETAEILGDATALVITGGHVGVLLDVLHVFNVRPAMRDTLQLIAWSAGAMALADRVVLFHDRAAHGPTVAEVYDAGLGIVRDIVALPHARRRLRIDDAGRMGVFARRFAPAQCLLLNDGVRVDLTPEGALPPGAQVLGTDGTLEESA